MSDTPRTDEGQRMIDPDQPFPEHDPLPDRCMFCGATIETMEDGSPCRGANDSWVTYGCFSTVHRWRSPRQHQSVTCKSFERQRLRSRLAELEAQVAGLRDPETMRANLLRGLVVLPSGYGETGPLEDRIKRLEDIIRRAKVRFCSDCSDEAAACGMLKILDEAKEAKP